ncbi:synaptotagmin-like protein 2 isoform X2 [Solea solea]|uniref:synaptotagmin-like protein 2 isoform X2 n=1 Tax=Solea solea TaxID=90069 RepID=UPI00272C34E4|nr:synaptotagmin-like protein 2 isoform X2 [Solea solea]
MIDLSFLTEEEQETILSVLQRDSELKKSEEQRVQKLHQSLSNRDQLKYLTGDWFYETKQLRHQDRIHGSDIILASMRHTTQKPLTILELSQILPEESSFVGSDNKEVFVPPLLCGLLQENNTDRYQNQDPYDTFKDIQSTTKQRKNPFNSELCAHQALEEDHTPEQTEDALPSFDCSISYVSNLRQDASLASQDASKNGAVSTGSNDSFADTDGPEGRQTNSSAPRGILKPLLSSSFTDTSVTDLDVQNPIIVDPSNDTWTDRRQVRFNSMVTQGSVERQKGKELGEHSLLDFDSSAPSEMRNGLNNYDLEGLGETSAGTQRPVLNQSQEDAQDDDVSCKNEAKLWGQEAGRHRVLGDVSERWHSKCRSRAGSSLVSAEQDPGKLVHQKTESEEDCHSQAKAKEGPTRHDSHRQNLPGQSADISVEARSDIKQSTGVSSASSSHAASPRLRQRLLGIFRRLKDKRGEVQSPQREEVKIREEKPRNAQILSRGAADGPVDKHRSVTHESREVRTLPLAALQSTTFEESVATIDVDTQQDVTEDTAVQVPEKLSNLRAFWETANTSPKNKFSRKERNEEDISGASHGLQTYAESLNKMSPHILSPQTEYKRLVDVSKEDGTYRANPVLIYEETDDSLTVLESQESFVTPVQKKLEGVPPNLTRQSSSSPPEETPAKISELRHFWEKETTGPRVITAKVKEDNKVVSPQPDRRTSIDNRENSDESKVLKSLKVTDKGFVIQSPERTRMMSSGGAGKVKADTKPQPRPLSPSKSKNHDDDVRMSPSKTCHPRVLPTESPSPKRSRLDGSPLKTFPINIDLVEQEKPSPMPRQTRSPLRGAKQPEDCDTFKTQHTPSTSPKSKPTPEKRVGSLTRLARSFIPQDYQHYLGPQEKEHVPPFHQEKSEENDLRDFVDNQSPLISSWIVQKKDGNSGQEAATTRAWSLPRASSSSYDDSPTSIMAALKRLSTRMTVSRSLEDLTSQPSEERTKYGSGKQMNQSLDDVSSLSPSASYSKQLNASVSVPVLQLDETDSDSTFDTSLSRRRNTGSSTSNISLSSGMASMSSVSGSISSIFHADYGNVEVQGNIQFAMNYIQKLGEFHIFVVHCRDLAVADTKKHRSDPYVKCYLLPDKSKLGKRKTTVKKKTLNPNYSEILRFKIFKELLRTHNLNVSVWHNDVFGRNIFLGEVDLDLSEWDFSNTQINEYTLKARVSAQTPAVSPSRQVDGRGQMRVALRFLPQTSHSSRTSRMETGEVQIWVKDCKSLPSVRGVIIDPFVKCTVLPDTNRKSRQKTRVVKRTANPMFNHTMVYDGFRAEDLREACVEITVWDHDRLNSHFIGGLRLGLGTGQSYGVDVPWMDSTTAEAHLWQRMLQSDGEWVEDVLPLRIFLMAMAMSK